MSISIIYFELKKPSQDFLGYKDVNNYRFPEPLKGYPKNIVFNLTNIKGMVLDDSIAPNMYYPEPNILRNTLLNFIAERLKNSCIQPVLYFYINENMEIKINDSEKNFLNLAELSNFFDEKKFKGLLFLRN